MRFLRQLAAVTAVVAVVVLIGLAWHHLAPDSFGVELNSGGTSGVPSIQLGDLLEPVNLAVLWNTAWIEAAVIAAVVIVDAGLRERRRARRGSSR